MTITLASFAPRKVDHAREIQRHTAGFPRPTLKLSDRDIIKEMVRG